MKSNNLKKIITGVTALCIMATMSINVSAMSFPGQQQVQGDLNENGSVDSADVLEMKKVVLGMTQLNGRKSEIADMNSDGSVNVLDLLMLKNTVLGIQGDVTTTPDGGGDVTTTPDDSGDVTTTTTTDDGGDVTTVTTEAPVVIQDAVKFTFSEDSITAYDSDGNEVESQMVDGTIVTITVPGEYSFDGECSEGQIIVNVDKDTYPSSVDGNTVTLSLEGLTLSNSTNSPIYVESIDDECVISSKKGTTNTISDGSSAYANYDDGVGAIYSKDDLKFKGKGTLIVNGNYEDGIVSKNDIKIWNSNITVNAQDDGIRGKDSVRIGDPDDLVANGGDGDYSNLSVTVNAKGGDAIKSTNYEDEGDGRVIINGGTISLTAYSDGIQAEQEVTINGGDLDITTTAQQSSSSSSSSSQPGGWGQDNSSSTTSDDTSAKGIKASLDESSTLTITEIINITGGTININSTDDSIHSNGDIEITGGTFTLASGDDGIHADGTLTTGTTGGALDEFTIYISECYEGLEGSIINQNAGTVIVNSEDDGYNAAGGADGSGNTSPGGWNQGSMSSSDCVMNINGGFVLVNAQDGDHDGFDSNGDLNINGGYVISNGNEPFDCGDGASLNYSGGVYVKNTGSSSGMGMSGTSNLTETVSVSGSISAGQRITIADESGNVIVSFLADKNVTSVIAGCSGYTSAVVYSGGTITGDALTGTGDQECYVSGTITGGTQVTGSSSTNPSSPW
ncbi:MAG: carbohydrate-binding domain-containing protein [Ruminococcus sp.]|nr:carbohydrate-binding domain-containing protein [Ruminococcus sp.]